MHLCNSLKNIKYAPCHESHPPLKIERDGITYTVYGGSCLHPTVSGLDVLVGLDGNFKAGKMGYPWERGTSFLFKITDMSVPTDLLGFNHLIEFLSDSILCGKKVFVGCIGGHGRTGLVLSALVTYMTGNKNSIEYVRENYCKKAVESRKQINWLNTNFGIKKVEPTKDFSYMGFDTTKYSYYGENDNTPMVYNPIACGLSIHGLNKRR